MAADLDLREVDVLRFEVSTGSEGVGCVERMRCKQGGVMCENDNNNGRQVPC